MFCCVNIDALPLVGYIPSVAEQPVDLTTAATVDIRCSHAPRNQYEPVSVFTLPYLFNKNRER